MKQSPRIYYTESQKTLVWDRWQKGESLEKIANLFERHHSSAQRIFSETGGIRPVKQQSLKIGFITGGTRRNIKRNYDSIIHANNCCSTGSFTFNHQS